MSEKKDYRVLGVRVVGQSAIDNLKPRHIRPYLSSFITQWKRERIVDVDLMHIKDAHNRFEQRLVHDGITSEQQLVHLMKNYKKWFTLYFVIAVLFLGSAIASNLWWAVFVIDPDSIATTILSGVLGLLIVAAMPFYFFCEAFKPAFLHYQCRHRALYSLWSFLKQPMEWMPY